MHHQPRNQVFGNLLGQLTLVEHSLCPIQSTSEPFIHETGFYYHNQRQRKRSEVRVTCPLGLLANDEFYLWGLLALTLNQLDADGELHATPHYCLRHLGVINQNTRRGGRQYTRFAEAIRRLSAVNYTSSAFYDPIRKEYRNVSFGFLSYSLPQNFTSSRAWRIVWNPLFFELVKPNGGHFLVDLCTYRELDVASRRMFFLLSKMFSRRLKQSPPFDLRHIGCDILGFSKNTPDRNLKVKIKRILTNLVEHEVVCDKHCDDWFRKSSSRGIQLVPLSRGRYFSQRYIDQRRSRQLMPAVDSALGQTLRELGFQKAEIPRIVTKYPQRILREWADITMAAKERHGPKFFKRSPQAYLIDNVKHAAAGTRTPPDWWHEMRKQEERLSQPRTTKNPNQLEPISQLLGQVFAELPK